jgi:quinol monooxygenase YgiN
VEAGFVQIIEFQTSRIDEFESLIDEIRSQPGPMPVVRATLAEDRDRPGYYLNIIEFESYGQAMENSNKPETTAMAERMAALCDGPPKFYNLNVRRFEQR